MVQCHKYKQLYIIVFVENGYMQTDNRLIQKETVFYCDKDFKLSDENYNAVKEAVNFYNLVGFLSGYYDEKLSIACVSSYFLQSLGYEYDEFMEISSGSFKNIFYGENQSFLDVERFKKIHGIGEGRMINKADAPVYVRMYKADSVDEYGNRLWVLSVQTDWVQQNLKLINNVLKSGMWYFDFDMKGNITDVFWSHEFRRMLGYHDVLDFPNTIEMWMENIYPEDREMVISMLQEAAADIHDCKKYNAEYRMRKIDAFHRAYTESNICEYYVNLKDNTFDSLKVENSLLGLFEKKYNLG